MIVERHTEINSRPYYGFAVEEVICGRKPNCNNALVDGYLTNLFNFLKMGRTDYDIVLPEGIFPKELLSEDGYGVNSYRLKKEFVFLKHVVLIENSKIFIDPSISLIEKKQISDFIATVLGLRFRGTRIYGTYNSSRDKPIFKKNDLRLFGNPEYIEWLISNDENFVLSRDLLQSTFQVKSLISFEVEPIYHNSKNKRKAGETEFGRVVYSDDSIIRLKPNFIERQFKFSKLMVDKNQKKLAGLLKSKNLRGSGNNSSKERDLSDEF